MDSDVIHERTEKATNATSLGGTNKRLTFLEIYSLFFLEMVLKNTL